MPRACIFAQFAIAIEDIRPSHALSRRRNDLTIDSAHTHFANSLGDKSLIGTVSGTALGSGQMLSCPKLNDELVFVELCAGSAILSATAQSCGFLVLPIDCKRNRHRPFTKLINLDLTSDNAWKFLEFVRDNSSVVAWHMGLPCGTCSRAREIPLAHGERGPQPLRNEQFPMGVPWMNQVDSEKVRQANMLYQHACNFALTLIRLSHVFTIENPSNSWLWELPCMTQLTPECVFVDFHSCMFGGARKKWTSSLSLC